MNRVLIIGKRGFIGQNLFKYLKKTNKVSHISFKKLKIIKKKTIVKKITTLQYQKF